MTAGAACVMEAFADKFLQGIVADPAKFAKDEIAQALGATDPQSLPEEATLGIMWRAYQEAEDKEKFAAGVAEGGKHKAETILRERTPEDKDDQAFRVWSDQEFGEAEAFCKAYDPDMLIVDNDPEEAKEFPKGTAYCICGHTPRAHDGWSETWKPGAPLGGCGECGAVDEEGDEADAGELYKNLRQQWDAMTPEEKARAIKGGSK